MEVNSRYLCAIGLPGVLSLGGWCRRFRTGLLRPRPTQGPGSVGGRSAYGAVTRYGAPFQASSATAASSFSPALQPRARLDARGLGWSPFARRYSGSHCCFPFLRLLRCFSSAGWPPCQVGTPPACRVSPFGHPRIKGRSRLPAAFRSLPRPSSPPGAKASPVRPPVLVAHRRLSRRPRGHGTIEYSSLLLVSRFLFQVLFACHFARPHALACAPATDFAFVSFLPSCQRAFPQRASASPPPSLAGRVENKGVEPLTPSLQSWCSSQLS